MRGVVCASLFFTAVGVERAAAAPESSGVSAGYRVVEAALPTGEVARTGTHVVTVSEVRARVAVLRSGARAGHEDGAKLREQALYQLLDLKYLSEQLRAAGLDKDPRVARMRRVLTRLTLARRYVEETIRPKITVSEKEIESRLPRGREEARLRILQLRDAGDESKIRAEAARGVPFEELVVNFSRTGAGFGLKGDLGFLQKNGLYFDPADEDELGASSPGFSAEWFRPGSGRPSCR